MEPYPHVIEKAKRNTPELLTSAYMGVMLSFYLLFPGSGGYMYITGAKFASFCWITGGYVLLMILFGLKRLLLRQAKIPSLRSILRASTWTQRFIVLFLFFTAISSLVSPHREATIIGASRYEGLVTITLYVAIFLLVSIYGAPRPFLIYIFGASMTVFCTISLLQLAGFNPLRLFPFGLDYYDSGVAYPGQYLGTVGNVDLVAALLCLAIPVFLISLLRLESKIRFLLAIPAALCSLVLTLSKVQAGIVGTFLGCFLIAPFVLPVSMKAKRNLALVLFGVLLLGLVLLWFYGAAGSGTLLEAHELLHGRAEESFGSGRIYIWKNVLKLIPERLWFGGGPDTLRLRMSATFRRYDGNLGTTIVTYIDTAHNEYLNLLVNQGLLSLLAYLAALAATWVRVIKADPSVASAICGGALLCYCIQAFFGMSMCLTAPFFWILWGLFEKSPIDEKSCSESSS